MHPNHKKFFLKRFFSLLFVAFIIFACSESEEIDDGPETKGNCPADGAVAQGQESNHYFVIPKEDIAAAIEKEYTVLGESGHSHNATVSVDMFKKLQKNEVISLSVHGGLSGHPSYHVFKITCQ
jgi:hypothetical protein